jgi:hypothetical protein
VRIWLRTFSSAVEFDIDLLVDVFCQIEDIFLLGSFLGLIRLLLRSAATAASAAPSVTTTSTSSPEMTSF